MAFAGTFEFQGEEKKTAWKVYSVIFYFIKWPVWWTFWEDILFLFPQEYNLEVLTISYYQPLPVPHLLESRLGPGQRISTSMRLSF